MGITLPSAVFTSTNQAIYNFSIIKISNGLFTKKIQFSKSNCKINKKNRRTPKMLETCQKRHMLLGLGLLVAATVVVLIIESRFSDNENARRSRAQQFVIENNSTCWQREEYTVIQECHPCTEFDIISKSLGVCIHTHYKEVLRCKSGETVTRSCDRVALVDQRNFIKFEITCFILGLFSYLISYTRDRILTRRTHLRIERQLNRMQ
ncbi:protein JTB [Ceratitis capitata]|uniref:protein JTB n=1 Tax=Ceratitis capitata TaxID=7213 RepID=UPI000A1208ED|nr:protein JTB [Ceratitis capitata]